MTLTFASIIASAGLDSAAALVIRHAYVREHEDGTVEVHLADTHPGREDREYLRRRGEIAGAALGWDRLFTALDWLTERLSGQRYLVGDTITEADVRAVLGRSSIPPPTPSARAAVDLAARRLGEHAGRGLPTRWADAVADAAAPYDDRLADGLDQAVLSTPLRGINPLWWVVLGALAATAGTFLVWQYGLLTTDPLAVTGLALVLLGAAVLTTRERKAPVRLA